MLNGYYCVELFLIPDSGSEVPGSVEAVVKNQE
jgi:hypothetical protein